MKSKITKSPWSWIPTLYFAQGLPYVVVMTLAVIMFKRLGINNTDIALYTSWLYLPWVIKPLWSPLVDIVKTKRWWDDHHAISDRWRISRNSTDSSRASCLPLLVSIHVVISFQFCHPRHRGRRVLYAGTRHQETSLLRRHP